MEFPTRIAYLPSIPTCNICSVLPATIDGPTSRGPWAYMCDGCANLHGGNLAMGHKLAVGERPVASREDILKAIEAGDFSLAEDLIGDGDIAEFI